MAKVIFTQRDNVEKLGVMYISSLLKQRGHSCKLFMGSSDFIIKRLREEKFDILAFSSVSSEKNWTLKIAELVKKSEKLNNKFVIVGGPLATFSPEIIDQGYIDAVCLGEGEYPMLELAEAIDERDNVSKIKNLWVKYRGKVYKNGLRGFIQNLDNLPFPDRGIYRDNIFQYKIENDFTIITTRGCPFQCSYCFHSGYKKIYGDLKTYVRTRSVDNVIEELEDIKLNFVPGKIWFYDSVFGLNLNWMEDFFTKYKNKISLPFICNLRVELMNEERLFVISNTNLCHCVTFGIESGDENYRKNMLNRNITDEQIVTATSRLRKYKLKFSTTNMVGLPGETLSQAEKTISINRKIRPHSAVCTIYQPLPKTELFDFCIKKNLIKENFLDYLTPVTHKNSILRQKDIDEIVNLHKFFYILIYYPFFMSSILKKKLIKIPLNKFFTGFYFFTYFYLYRRKIHNISLIKTIKIIAIAFKYYYKII